MAAFIILLIFGSETAISPLLAVIRFLEILLQRSLRRKEKQTRLCDTFYPLDAVMYPAFLNSPPLPCPPGSDTLPRRVFFAQGTTTIAKLLPSSWRGFAPGCERRILAWILQALCPAAWVLPCSVLLLLPWGRLIFFLYASAPLRPGWMPYIRFRAHQSHGGTQFRSADAQL